MAIFKWNNANTIREDVSFTQNAAKNFSREDFDMMRYTMKD